MPHDTFLGFFKHLFSTDFLPHGHCFFWRPDIVWLHVLSDGFIALSYFSIPLMLIHFTRKRKDVPFPGMFLMFAAFIVWCGTTHLFNILTLWYPIYRLDGVVKAITAGISVATAIVLFPLIPKALSLKSPRELRAKNLELEAEITKREEAQSAVERQRAILQKQATELTLAHEKLREINDELEKRVTERTRALEASNRELEHFAYIASHDLKEPLRMISLYVQLLDEKTKEQLDDQTEEYIHYVVEGADRMRKLIDALLAYSRVGKEASKQSEVDCSAVTREVLKPLELDIKERGTKVSIGTLPSVVGDGILIRQVFQNLISNAIKFGNKENPEVSVEAEVRNGTWEFVVRDNGIGIEPKYQDRIFTIFQRLHTREEYPGTGIGLALCKKIIEFHGGSIWVDSKYGVGSAFHFALPMRPSSSAEKEFG